MECVSRMRLAVRKYTFEVLDRKANCDIGIHEVQDSLRSTQVGDFSVHRGHKGG
jgi:hypothetical protein